jgi:hypothetical protein
MTRMTIVLFEHRKKKQYASSVVLLPQMFLLAWEISFVSHGIYNIRPLYSSWPLSLPSDEQMHAIFKMQPFSVTSIVD